MTDYDLQELLDELDHRKTHGGAYHRYFTEPDSRALYPKQWAFFDAGAEHRQRLFRAANRVGKTTAAGTELTYHLTGRYPAGWVGKRFDGASAWWVGGKSSETVRQILQPLLLGPIGAFGTGLIPEADLDHGSLVDAKKAATPVASFRVRHVTGGWSLVEFKSYDQGRQAFEGTERSIWCDEEPPEDVYSECLLRTMTGGNVLMLTFTPLKGASKVVLSFSRDGLFEEGTIGESKHVTTCSWDDAPHLSEKDKKELLSSIPPFQRDARTKGVPALGAGAIYPVPESDIVVDPFSLPRHWKRSFALDVGWRRTAALWGATDPESGVLYLYSEHYISEQVPAIHAEGLRARGEWIPGVIDPAARGRSQDDGIRLMETYKNLGLDIEKSANAVESALFEIWEAFLAGRVKVFSNLTSFLREYRSYVRDEKGRIVKENDHLMDCLRYLWLSGRDRAKNELEGLKPTVLNSLPNVGARW